MGTLEALLELEQHGWDSLCDGTGDRFYADLMTQHGRMILAHGMALDRDATIAALREAPNWSGYAITDPALIQLGSDASVLVYTGRAWRGEDEPEFNALMSSTYVRTPDGWRLALYQQTPIPENA